MLVVAHLRESLFLLLYSVLDSDSVGQSSMSG